MRAFVLVSLFAVGLCGVLPGGYDYNGGSSFDHNGLVGPLFGAGSNNAPVIGGGLNGPNGGGGGGFNGQNGGGFNGPSGQSSNFGGSPAASNNVPSIGGGFNGPNGGGFGGPNGAGGFNGANGGGFNGPNGGGFSQQPIGSPSSGSPSIAPQFPSGGFDGGFDSAPAANHEAPLITKQFFLHSAPEDHSSIGKTKHFVLGRPQKNYRVVFIKAPSDASANARLSAEYAPQEEKTVIYVLSQKEHDLDVNDIATPAPTQPSKPEVFFIKYKTPEEAAHAQQEIQNQYNVLGGQTQVSDEGTAPVSDVSNSLTPASSNRQSNVGYLPPSH